MFIFISVLALTLAVYLYFPILSSSISPLLNLPQSSYSLVRPHHWTAKSDSFFSIDLSLNIVNHFYLPETLPPMASMTPTSSSSLLLCFFIYSAKILLSACVKYYCKAMQ